MSGERVREAALWGAVWSRRLPAPNWPERMIVPENAVLQSRVEWVQAAREMRRLRLPQHPDGPKNWDTLAAIGSVLRRTDAMACVLDAGAARYSTFLPALRLYGYRDLVGINLEFQKAIRHGPVRFEHGDLTKTRFDDESFDAVACLSVIEHGVDLSRYFVEMARVLKPGGILVTSTDYWHEPVDTWGKTAYGQPVHIFTPGEIEHALHIAAKNGLHPTGPIQLSCGEKAVSWKRFGLEYTFIVFTLERTQR
jgi:SAM-dependent methyltransferase